MGLVITQSLAIAVQVEWGMKQSADVANQMTSVERVLEYATLPTEENNKGNNIFYGYKSYSFRNYHCQNTLL